MKLQKVAAIITASALTLALTGCAKDDDFDFGNTFESTQQNTQSGGTVSNPAESSPAESKPTESNSSNELPDIPVTEESAFEYHYDSELDGMVVTNYKLKNPEVHIPDKLDNKPVVKVSFDTVGKEITHLIMPDSVKSFHFSEEIKRTLQYANVPASTSVIGLSFFVDDCSDFFGCSSLKNVSISEGVTEISMSAFGGCSSLTSITIPASVNWVDAAFMGCTSLTSIEVAEGNPNCFSIDGILYCTNSDGKTYLINCPGGKSGSINIHDGTNEIYWYAFHDLVGITDVTIPDSVTNIDDFAFYGCTSIANVTMSKNLIEIGADAFSGCASLTSITIPDGVTVIANSAFEDCVGLTNITIPDSVTYVGIEAFARCSNLTDVTIGNGVTRIGLGAFHRCTSLKNITLGSGVIKLERAFGDCTSLTSIIIPDSVTEIDAWEFHGCDNIQATYKGKTYDYAHIDDLYKAINGN